MKIMVTVCLDESGNFENINYYKKFIGGLVYIGDDWEIEKNNIEEFFLKECNNIGLKYPQDIHSTEVKWKASKDKIDAYEKLIEKFKEYIGKNGRYSFTYIVKGKGSKNNFNNSNIVRENEASNLYELMANELINNILFYTLEFEDNKKYNLNIATRSIETINETLIEELKKLGFASKHNEDKIFYLTDQKSYKAAITNKIINSKINKKVDIQLNVESINYKNKANPALYIADLACDIIKESLGNSEDFDIKKSYEILRSITNNSTLAWAYDEIDNLYNDVYSNYIGKDLIKSILNIYDIKKSKSSFRNYYLQKWVNSFEDKLIDIFDKEKIEVYLSQVEYLFRKDIKEYDRALNVCTLLIDVINKNNQIKKHNIKGKYMYRLSENILKGYNHQGNVKEARKYFEECVKLKDQVSIEEYLATLNRGVEIDANELNFKSAIEKLNNILDVLDMQKERRKDICELLDIDGEKAYSILSRGKVLSSLGQMNSFINAKEKAVEYFEEALKEFGENTLMKKITMSYILHLAIDVQDIKLYKKYEEEYFGTENLQEQFENIVLKNKSKHFNDFDFYVYVKALKVFFMGKANEKLLNTLYVTNYDDKGFKLNEHPWQLIYKNLALLFYNKGNKKFAERLMEKALTSVTNKGITIELINICSELQYALFENNTKVIGKTIKIFQQKLIDYPEIGQIFKEYFDFKESREIGERIVSKFRYMYT